jgi:Leucine-rich repeat (LRR) protein
MHKLKLSKKGKKSLSCCALLSLVHSDAGFAVATRVELRGVCEDASSFRRIVNSAETNVNLSWQKLASLDGATLAQLSKLKTLLLQFNKLTAVPDEIGTLTDLIELALYRNELETLPESLGSLVNLEKLWLNDNKVRESWKQKLIFIP